MSLISQCLGLALWGVVLTAAADVVPAPGNGAVTVSVTRRDLRPMLGVTLQLTGAVNHQAVTDENGRAEFIGLPLAGSITITPSRSGFRFEPPQLTIPLANPSTPAFVAFPTATDLELSMVSDDAAPLVGGLINGVITLRNLGAQAATDVTVGFSSLPGLALEDTETTQGRLEYQRRVATGRNRDGAQTSRRVEPGRLHEHGANQALD